MRHSSMVWCAQGPCLPLLVSALLAGSVACGLQEAGAAWHREAVAKMGCGAGAMVQDSCRPGLRFLSLGARGGRAAAEKCGTTLCMVLRGGGKNKHRQHAAEVDYHASPDPEHAEIVQGKERKDRASERAAEAAEMLQEQMLHARETVELQHDPTGDLQQNLEPLDDEEIDERWSYLKHAENEMRRAEEKTAQQDKEFQEHQEKRRSGLIQDNNTDVIDTLRWPSAQDDFAGKRGQRFAHTQSRASHEEEEHVVLEGEGADDEELTVREWLDIHGLGMYSDTFETEGWDSIEAVHTMSQEDMLDIGVKRGHVRRLMLAMGREPPPMRMESMSRSGAMSMARSSMARSSMPRGQSYARYRPEGSQARTMGWGYDRNERERERERDEITEPPGRYRERERDDITEPPGRYRERERDDITEPPGRYQHHEVDYGGKMRQHSNDHHHHSNWREQADRENGLKANVKTHFGPGGSSRLSEAGGLGAFLMGGDADEDENIFRGGGR